MRCAAVRAPFELNCDGASNSPIVRARGCPRSETHSAATTRCLFPILSVRAPCAGFGGTHATTDEPRIPPLIRCPRVPHDAHRADDGSSTEAGVHNDESPRPRVQAWAARRPCDRIDRLHFGRSITLRASDLPYETALCRSTTPTPDPFTRENPSRPSQVGVMLLWPDSPMSAASDKRCST